MVNTSDPYSCLKLFRCGSEGEGSRVQWLGVRGALMGVGRILGSHEERYGRRKKIERGVWSESQKWGKRFRALMLPHQESQFLN